MLIREWVGFIIVTTILGRVAQRKALPKAVALVEFEHWFASRRHKPIKLGLVALRENCSKIMRKKILFGLVLFYDKIQYLLVLMNSI